jgi:hypothetical protein
MRIAAKYTPFALILGFALAIAPLAGAAGATVTVEGTDSDTTFTTSFSKSLRSKIR